MAQPKRQAQGPPTEPPPSGAAHRAAIAGGVYGTIVAGQSLQQPGEATMDAAQVAATTTAIIIAVRKFLRRRQTHLEADTLAILRNQHPAEDDERLREALREETRREVEFQEKMLTRLAKDLPEALKIAD